MPSIMEEMQAAGATDPSIIEGDAPPARVVKRPGGKPPAPQAETKRDRYYRIMEPRVRSALNAIRVVGLMGGPNKSNYDYGPSDIEAIERVLNDAVADAAARLMRKPRQLPMFKLPRTQPNGG